MQTRPRIKLSDALLYDLQRVAVDVAQERRVPRLPLNELLEEVVRAFVIEHRSRKASPSFAQG